MLNQIDLSRADLNLLVLFEAVMAERHVGRAAERLSLSPSAVSHGLGRLRTLLGDPLFLRTPKGVTPTDRANELATPIADVLSRIRDVVATSAPFDAARSTRRFTIGAPDGVLAVVLPPLLDALKDFAPGVDISTRQVLPKAGEPSPSLAWQDVFGELEARALDVAILPLTEAPTRFAAQAVYEEDFVVAMRAGHPFAKDASLKAYCAASHLVVSQSGDPFGFVDAALAQRKMKRRVALTTPNFMFALAMLAETDLIAALPRRFVEAHAGRFGVVSAELPLKAPRFTLALVTPKAAMKDAGIAWLAATLTKPPQKPKPAAKPKARKAKR